METNSNKSGQVWPREITICGRFLKRERLESERVPELRLMGKWLREVFSIGTRVAITCADGKLIIEPAREQPWLGKQKPMRIREVPDDVTAVYRPGHDGSKHQRRVAEPRGREMRV
ncbi:type I toxin-antitoxin system SymE family toxin [Fulvivirgaceae bacterium PWU5]|uniref:Type I toxin-antitoxin system SymE family toxin n=1 Tax=Dawidia cretensis TaxID=2782350 RepID=A0AAP2GX24_9BACT|nr:type I toxin-antitoxin system SymE family toxin [Dawidia cretensis]